MTPPILSRQQVRQIDRRAIEDYGMSSLVLMENAGRGCVDCLCRWGIAGPVVICCGKGNNAGDGLVIARHLEIRGYRAEVLGWAQADQLRGDVAANYRIIAKTDVPVMEMGLPYEESHLSKLLHGADWIVDALLGTGAQGPPRPPLDSVIELINAQRARKLAIDVPSGLDCDTGQPAQHTIRADHTCTFVASKPGFAVAGAQAYTGQVHVLDIGVSPKLIEQIREEGKK